MNGVSDGPTPEFGFTRPPPRIRLLMFWTACTAIYLGIVTAAFPTSEWAPTGRLSVTLALSSPSLGAGLVGLVVLFRHYRRRDHFAPGEELLWILGLCCLAVILRSIGQALVRLTLVLQLGPFETPIMIILCIFLVLPVLFALGAWIGLVHAANRARVWRWRLHGYVLFAVTIACWVEFASITDDAEHDFFFFPILCLIAAGSLGVAAWFDWRQETHYPWTHWAGLLCFGWLLMTLVLAVTVL